MYAATGTTVTFFVHVWGVLDVSSLSTAWKLLVHEYPVLRSSIDESEAGFALVADPQFVARPLQCLSGETDFEPFPPIRPGEPLSNATVFSSGDEHTVGVAFHHAIADGELMYFFLTRLWEQYRRVVAGDAPRPDPRPLPGSPIAVLGSRGWESGGRSCFHRIFDLPRYAHAVREDVTQGPDLFLRNSAMTHLKLEEAARIREVCRGRSVSPASVLAAAVAVAERELLAGEGELPLGVTSIVNLRERVSPPVVRDEATNMVGYSIAKLFVRPGGDLCDLASRIVEQVREDLTEGVTQRTEHNMQEFLATWAQHSNLEPIATSVFKVRTPLDVGPELEFLSLQYRESLDYSALAPPEGQPFRPSLSRRHAIYMGYDEWRIRTTYPAAVLSASQTQDFVDRVRELLTAL